ncbi:MAG: replicative DNA helicase, partial [Chloroflexota bacterium]|nr:replicative DNA helicase [Chloroflexota bacterium]
ICVHNTACALSMCHNSAIKYKSRVAIFSLEMSAEQLVQRLLCMEGGIDQARLRTGYISEDEWGRIIQAAAALAETDIYIDDSSGVSTMEMRSKARRLHSERPLDLVIVDYLQLMQGGATASENRVQEISKISRELKGLARELQVPVVALSQVSRAVDARTSHIPMLSDLRESGCLTGATPVYLPDSGTYRPIAELVGQRGFRVLALNTDTWRHEPAIVTNAFSTGVKPVYRLTTRLGRTIRATANHKFLTINGWARLDEMGAGTRVAAPRTLIGPSQATMSDSELALLGHLIGDGCTLPRHTIQYTTHELALAETVAQLATDVFGDRVAPRISKERQWYQVYLVASERLTHGKRNPIAAWLDDMSVFGLRSHEKRVPDRVFAQPPTSIARFLRHLWATDGSIHLGEGENALPRIYYATSSLLLARNVQSLLLRLSINAKLTCHSQGAKGRDQYHVGFRGKVDVERFLSLVGGLGHAKEIHQEAIIELLASRSSLAKRDTIPAEVWQLYALPAMQCAGITPQQAGASLGLAHGIQAIYGQNLSRERAARVAQVVQCEQLARLAASDVYWDEIVSIEPDGEEEVYDLTVDDLHNFIASDILSHNSIEQDADIVMFIYRDKVYNPDTEKEHIADLIVAKHRNGPTGQISLFFNESQTRFIDLAPGSVSGGGGGGRSRDDDLGGGI